MTCVWLRGPFDAIPSATQGRTCVRHKDCYRRTGGCRPTALDDDDIVDDCRQAERRESVMASRLAPLARGTTRFGLPRGRPARERRPNQVVRKGGLEPPRYCYRQLKLANLLRGSGLTRILRTDDEQERAATHAGNDSIRTNSHTDSDGALD